MNTPAQSDGLLETIKEFARWHHLNEMTVAAGNTPSDSEIDFEVVAWSRIERALAALQSASVEQGIIELLVAGKPFVFDPATKSFHDSDCDISGAVSYEYEPTSWNYAMDGFDMEAARIGRAAFERVVDLGLASDTSNDADEIIEAIGMLHAPSEVEGMEELALLAKAANKAPHHIYTNARDDDNWRANADFHAAASPDAVLALIASAASSASCPAGNGAAEENLVDRLAASLAVFTRHYESWMDDWKDGELTSTYSRHTVGDLRNALRLIEEANVSLHRQTKNDDPRVMVIVRAMQKARQESRLLDVETAKHILKAFPKGEVPA